MSIILSGLGMMLARGQYHHLPSVPLSTQAHLLAMRRLIQAEIHCYAEQSGLHPQGSGLGEKEKEAELPLWEADWDDEDVGGDFVQHLNAELAKKS